jgi:hypothetical protein
VIGEALLGPDEIAWRRRMAVELDDLRAAVNWSLDQPEDDRCVQIVAALSVQAAQYDTAGIGTWADRCVERGQAAPPPLRTAVLGAAAWNRARRGDPDAVAVGLDALRDGLPPGWPSSYLPFMALTLAWGLQFRLDNAAVVAASGHAALDAAEAAPVGHTHLHCMESMFTVDPDAARQFAEAALSNAQACDNPTGLAVGWFAVGSNLFSDDPARAFAALEQSIALTRNGAGDGIYPFSLVLAAVLASRSGDADTAIAFLDEALRYGRDSGNQQTVASAVAMAVIIMTDLGHLELAAVLAGAGGERAVSVLWASDHVAQYEDVVARLRMELGSPAFDAACANGSAMSYEQVAVFLVSGLAHIRTSIAGA